MLTTQNVLIAALLLASGWLIERPAPAFAEPLPPERLLVAQADAASPELLERLNNIPVFGIVDDNGEPILGSGDRDGQALQVVYVWMDPDEALSVFEEVRQEDPELVADAEVSPFSFGELLAYAQSEEMPDDLLLQTIPRQEDVAAARELWAQEDSGRDEEFNGIPVFFASTGTELLLIESEGEEVIPVFLSKADLQASLLDVARENPEISRQVRIEATTLESLLAWMEEPEAEPFLPQIAFFPAWDVVEPFLPASNDSE